MWKIQINPEKRPGSIVPWTESDVKPVAKFISRLTVKPPMAPASPEMLASTAIESGGDPGINVQHPSGFTKAERRSRSSSFLHQSLFTSVN
jgi:hypothetical protein